MTLGSYHLGWKQAGQKVTRNEQQVTRVYKRAKYCQKFGQEVPSDTNGFLVFCIL